MDSCAAAIERDTHRKYSGLAYGPDTVSPLPAADSSEYFNVLLRTNMAIVRRHAWRARVLDLCCGTGRHLLSLADIVERGVGIDFSRPFIETAGDARDAAGAGNIEFVEGNARNLPFGDATFDLVYSFSALYHIPDVGDVIRQVRRVLRPGGRCVLELGNLYSLNTVVTKAYPQYATPCHVPVRRMTGLLRGAGLAIVEHRAFQILPLWGHRPVWLAPLLWPFWKWILQRPIRGRMLDEWISGMPLMRKLAFRHLFVCERT
ncbi:MAG TPA: class I SAM-dependent methyltransferase [Phycisphaerae bacterium]|nr:class I SAM-dependent methyltransferase [Phycisphaerae bacterium]